MAGRFAALFTPEERDSVATRVVEVLGSVAGVSAVVKLGSYATGTADRHSDIDLAAVVTADADVRSVANLCTEALLASVPVFHHFSQSLGELEFRGLLLESFLEIDLGFGRVDEIEAATSSPRIDAVTKLDFIWHDVIHAAIALDRGRPWRALWYLERLRNGTLELAAGRLGLDARHFKDVDDLPPETLFDVRASFPAGHTEAQIWPALRAVTTALFTEGRLTHPEISNKLEPKLLEFLDLISPNNAPEPSRG